MRRYFYLIAVVALLSLSLGCTPTEKKADVPPPPTAPQQEAPAPAPQADAAPAAAPVPAPVSKEPESANKIVNDYRRTLMTPIGKSKGTQEKVDTAAVKIALQSYYSEHEKYPESLDEIKGYLKDGTDLSIYNYDPATGTVSLK